MIRSDQPIEVAVILIQDGDGKFFAHQRSAEKKLFPNLYGLGAGGKRDPGESAQEAAHRELKEETGWDVLPKSLFSFEFQQGETRLLLNVFLAICEGTPSFLPDEWQWSGWLERDEVDSLAAEGKLCPDTAIFYERFCALNLPGFK